MTAGVSWWLSMSSIRSGQVRTVRRVPCNEAGEHGRPGLARAPSARALADRIQEVLKAVEVPIAEALVEIPRHPEPGPALAPLVDELTRALVRVPGRGKHHGQKPPRDVFEVEKLSGSGHRERVGRVDPLAQRHHRWDRHRNPAPGQVRIEVLVVEVLSEDVEPLQLAVEEKPDRLGLCVMQPRRRANSYASGFARCHETPSLPRRTSL